MGQVRLSSTNLRIRHLRRNMTDNERARWAVLRRKNFAGFRFRRQQSIGPYIADFFCPSAKLVVELDGEQHAEKSHLRRDDERTRWLRARGYRVLRIWNADLKRSPKDVYEAIYIALAHPPSGPSGHLPPQGGKVG